MRRLTVKWRELYGFGGGGGKKRRPTSGTEPTVSARRIGLCPNVKRLGVLVLGTDLSVARRSTLNATMTYTSKC
jgi:hypothetical protein